MGVPFGIGTGTIRPPTLSKARLRSSKSESPSSRHRIHGALACGVSGSRSVLNSFADGGRRRCGSRIMGWGVFVCSSVGRRRTRVREKERGKGKKVRMVLKMSSRGIPFNRGSSFTAVPIPTITPSCIDRNLPRFQHPSPEKEETTHQCVINMLSSPLSWICRRPGPAIFASRDWA